jgi:hypothetical protein
MENIGILYGHLVYYTTIRNLLWPFGIFCSIFPRFGILDQEKSGKLVRNHVRDNPVLIRPLKKKEHPRMRLLAK